MRPLPPASGADPLPARTGVTVASYVLIAAMLLLVMVQGLLAGLLCVCVGFLATRWIARGFCRLWRSRKRAVPPAAGCSGRTVSPGAQIAAAALVIAAPILMLSAALSQSRTFILHAPEQYRELLDHTARTVLEFREKLPPEIGQHLPDGADDLQRVVAHYLRAQAGSLAITGRAWLHALLFAYVGLIVGALAGCARSPTARGPLSAQLHRRITLFGEAFGQIVAAQFWIAAFNMVLTAVFLLGILPLWNMELPYAPALITLTFLAGLVPIVGNLLCNAVITVVGLSVSPATAAACLGFLILIHKAEYLINAKVVGQRTHMAVWELLAVMFLAEAVFGPAGLVAAPLFYAYLKKELEVARLV
ncbi:AI-2E family transporter [Xylophilus sp. Leaf220]|uniref:AI-2E family transporter n=1 Tax=Xylophilus sp. Leaf220 TaxID=1735686 RepID=UPI0006F21DC8|nr:AI-2E family transporter [Xylophilus sp. Leaf220]KQM69074.1 permease [Xylophilus sp. Leaf220]